MAATPVEKKIGDTLYRVTPFGARKARSVLFLLSKLLGSALATLPNGIGEAVGAWARNASETDFDAVCSALENGSDYQQTVSTNGAAVWMPLGPSFDSHFSGRLDEMGLWMIFALEVNFASFYSGKLAGDFLKMAKPEPSKPPTG